jgi:hypothetical protein
MVKGIYSVASRACPTSHLFSWIIDSLKLLGQHIFFPFLVSKANHVIRWLIDMGISSIAKHIPRGTC